MFLLCISDVIITSKKEATYLLITRNRLQTNDKNHDYKKSKLENSASSYYIAVL